MLRKSWSRKTSADPNGWTKENPAWGQCAVTALVAQDFFGGELLRASLKGIKSVEFMGSHYWNRLPNIEEEDFTQSQFTPGIKIPEGKVRTRKYLLSYPKTRKRYVALRIALEKQILGQNNFLFNDRLYHSCFETALDSECQKMKFACLVYHKDKLVVKAYNKTIEALGHLCQPKCMRFKIASRTQSMLGACGHAEEWAIWQTVGLGIPLKECSFYIAGFRTTNKPWLKEKGVHTCLRCAVQMHLAGVGKIYVPVVDHWEHLTNEEALKTAVSYATGEKKI